VRAIARAACEVFIAKGYRRTLLTDVAERLELSHALFYRYVEGKEALLELAIRYAMDPDADLETVVPVATPQDGHIVGLIRDWLAERATFPELRGALDRGPSGRAAAELAGIIDELYGFVEQNRRLLLLIESLADDFPELGGDSVNRRKRAQTDRLAAFLASRAATGELRPLPDPQIAARFLSESIAWFAQHRQRDADAALLDDRQARASVRQLLLATFVPDPPRAGAHH
jgi:AcrR family transcriptional regulator